MKVVIAIDSFKGSVDSRQAGDAARRGVLAADPSAGVTVLEIADGGEGTLSALLSPNGGERVSVPAVDALGRPLESEIGVFRREGRRRAVVESASTIGINLVPVDSSLPPRASSVGLGRQLLAALDLEVDDVLVTLGGTATTDGGSGLLLALGASILDEQGEPVHEDENPLWRFGSLDVDRMVPLEHVQLVLLSDVTNPLLGPRGAAHVFGPQKGATPDQVRHLDFKMHQWADALKNAFGVEVQDTPGAGAAGGLGAALLALGARAESGFSRVASEIGLAKSMSGADLVLTGEGSLDSQSAHGKVPSGVARLARENGAVVVGLAGRVVRPLGDMSNLLDAAFAIHSEVRSLEAALDANITSRELESTAFEATRLVLAARRPR